MIRKQMDSNSVESNAYLETLKGKRVTVYRGGPESRVGRLLDVQSDYVALMPENSDNSATNNSTNNHSATNNSIVYYNLRHVQSISENSKANSVESNLRQVQSISENLNANTMESPTVFDDYPELLLANDFTELLKKMVGSVINVNQGGPEFKTGIVLNVADDYMILLTEDDGIVFYNTIHVKSVSEQNNSESDAENDFFIDYNYFDNIDAKNFYDLFDYFAYKWISINRGGPEALEGVLVQEEGEHYTLVNNNEVIRVYPYHIKSISIGSKGSLKQQQNNNETAENEGDEDEDMTYEDDRASDRDYRSRHRTSGRSHRSRHRTSGRSHRSRHRTSGRDHRSRHRTSGRSHRSRHRTSGRSHRSRHRTSGRSHRSRHRTSGRDHRSRHRTSGRSHRSHRRSYSQERTVKTIDYVWDPR
jgi:spore coat protein B